MHQRGCLFSTDSLATLETGKGLATTNCKINK